MNVYSADALIGYALSRALKKVAKREDEFKLEDECRKQARYYIISIIIFFRQIIKSKWFIISMSLSHEYLMYKE